MKCLFVIDVQNGFVSDQTRMILPGLEQLMADFDGAFILATQFINTRGSGFTDIMGWDRLQAPPETDLIPFVRDRAAYVVEKRTYSACTEEVMELLRAHRITEVYLTGIDTDCCVLATAISLFEHNIRPVVLTRYCASNGGAESHRAALTVLERTIGAAQISDGPYRPC